MQMRQTATATAINSRPTSLLSGIPTTFHIAAAVWVAGMLLFSQLYPDHYHAAVQEDRLVEWLTVTLYVCAAYLRLKSSIPSGRLFDSLVGLFCIFVAGEEFSWGQRLLGFTPPATFLENNTQQELTLHNFADVFGRPKTVLMLALFGFGILLPLLHRWSRTRPILEKIGATCPPNAAMPWFALSIILLLWYPVHLTGEWVEALGAALFLVTSTTSSRAFWRTTSAAVAGALVLTLVSLPTFGRDHRLTQCARAETSALLEDIGASLSVYHGLLERDVHKRLQAATAARYLNSQLPRFRAVKCPGDEDALVRRKYGVDPWGLAYWVRSEANDSVTIISVYSFGPNRRRDNQPGGSTGDDIVRSGRAHHIF
jgi:hypothetical protein